MKRRYFIGTTTQAGPEFAGEEEQDCPGVGSTQAADAGRGVHPVPGHPPHSAGEAAPQPEGQPGCSCHGRLWPTQPGAHHHHLSSAVLCCAVLCCAVLCCSMVYSVAKPDLFHNISPTDHRLPDDLQTAVLKRCEAAQANDSLAWVALPWFLL